MAKFINERVAGFGQESMAQAGSLWWELSGSFQFEPGDCYVDDNPYLGRFPYDALSRALIPAMMQRSEPIRPVPST